MVACRALKPLDLGGKLLRKGYKLLILFRQLLKDEKVWVSDVNEFKAFRFAKDKSLTRHWSFKSFNGGLTYCPGRVLAKQGVFGFVAILLHRFDLDLSSTRPGGPQQALPQLGDTTPALGISGPLKGMDLFANVKVRKY